MIISLSWKLKLYHKLIKETLKMKTIIGFIVLLGIVSLSFSKNDIQESIEAIQEQKLMISLFLLMEQIYMVKYI